MLEYKSVPFEIKELSEKADGGWEIAGYASTFGGTPDSYGDVIVAGAFAESIANRPTKFLYEHTEPIGRQIELYEDDKGLFGRWSIVDTQTGTDAHKLAKAGVLDSLSIGYVTEEADFREDGVRLLRKVELFEVSAVAIPANSAAVITAVKTGRIKPFDVHSDDVRVAVAEWLERIKSGSDIRQKDGKDPLTEARKEALTLMSGSLREAVDAMDALLIPPPAPVPPERLHLGLELRRRRLERHGIAIGATP